MNEKLFFRKKISKIEMKKNLIEFFFVKGRLNYLGEIRINKKRNKLLIKNK